MNLQLKLLIIAAFMWNMTVFLMMGLDKLKAKKGWRRISERALMSAVFLFGSLGGFCGMYFFRHKTRQPKFYYGVPIMLAVHAFIIYLTFFC